MAILEGTELLWEVLASATLLLPCFRDNDEWVCCLCVCSLRESCAERKTVDVLLQIHPTGSLFLCACFEQEMFGWRVWFESWPSVTKSCHFNLQAKILTCMWSWKMWKVSAWTVCVESAEFAGGSLCDVYFCSEILLIGGFLRDTKRLMWLCQ